MSAPATAFTVLALSLSTLAIAAPASATPRMINDRSAWEANTLLRVDRNFDSLPGDEQTLLASPYIDEDVSFTATNDYLYSWGPAGCCKGADPFGTGGNWLIGPWNDGSLIVKMPRATSSVGFDVAAYNGFPPLITATIRMQSGRSYSATLTPRASQGHVFFGFADGQDYVATVTFKSSNGDNVVLDNVSTGITLGP